MKDLPSNISRPEGITKAVEMMEADEGYRTPGILKTPLSAFWELRSTLPIDDGISFIDIKAYIELMGVQLDPQMIRLILALDNTYREQYYKEKKE